MIPLITCNYEYLECILLNFEHRHY